MKDDFLYEEKLTSRRTEALFLALMIIFLSLMAWRMSGKGLDGLAVVFLVFSGLFLFYSLNFRVLIIRLSPQSLQLTFGLFTWKVALENMETFYLDQDIPLVMRFWGAGIHFMVVRNRYRASFNFLEYPRVTIAFKRQVGPVRDISFSTRRPDEILRLIQAAASASPGA